MIFKTCSRCVAYKKGDMLHHMCGFKDKDELYFKERGKELRKIGYHRRLCVPREERERIREHW